MARPQNRIDPRLRRLLDDSGLPWDLELGKKHMKLTVQGRLAGVLPYTRQREGGRTADNLLSAVRRLISQIKPLGV